MIRIGRSGVQGGRTGSIMKKGGQDRRLGVWDVGGGGRGTGYNMTEDGRADLMGR